MGQRLGQARSGWVRTGIAEVGSGWVRTGIAEGNGSGRVRLGLVISRARSGRSGSRRAGSNWVRPDMYHINSERHKIILAGELSAQKCTYTIHLVDYFFLLHAGRAGGNVSTYIFL